MTALGIPVEFLIFALTLIRLLLAYRTGSMRYCLLVFERPDR